MNRGSRLPIQPPLEFVDLICQGLQELSYGRIFGSKVLNFLLHAD